ncbi:MAG: glycosyltransferase family 2 protein [Paludibacter sp.]
MKISVIIITWNGSLLLRNCLKSLDTLMERSDVEVIVVDNGSEDDTVAFMKSNYQSIQFIELSQNFGVAYARNKALEKAVGEYLFILDNDTVVSREAIEYMEIFMDTHPDAGMCGCKLIDGNGIVQENCKKYPGIKEKVANVMKGKEYRYSYTEETRSQIFSPEYLIGACQFIRSEAYKQVGSLDEHIFYGPEDADYCLRIQQKGWKIYFIPHCSIQHLCQRMTNKRLLTKMSFVHVKALFYFYFKYKRFLS